MSFTFCAEITLLMTQFVGKNLKLNISRTRPSIDCSGKASLIRLP